MGKAFSIAELVIVAAVIGILAALLMPTLHQHAMDAKEAAARENLQLLRAAIELYTARHQGIAPGYENNDPSTEPTAECFRIQAIVEDRCLLQIPENPFNNLDRVRIIGNDDAFRPRRPVMTVGFTNRRRRSSASIDPAVMYRASDISITEPNRPSCCGLPTYALVPSMNGRYIPLFILIGRNVNHG